MQKKTVSTKQTNVEKREEFLKVVKERRSAMCGVNCCATCPFFEYAISACSTVNDETSIEALAYFLYPNE